MKLSSFTVVTSCTLASLSCAFWVLGKNAPKCEIVPQNSDCISAERYGASTVSADNTPAWNAALAALPDGRGCISFGPGKFKFSSSLSATVREAFSVRGTETGITELDFVTSSDGMAFEVAPSGTLVIEKLTVASHYPGIASNVGISVRAASTENSVSIHDVVVQGDARRTTGWGVGIRTTNLGSPSLQHVKVLMPNGNGAPFGPVGISVNGSSRYLFGVDAKLIGIEVQGGHIGLNVGPWVQGVFVVNSEMIGCDWPIYANAPDTLGELIMITNSHLSGALGGIYGAGISQSLFSNNLILRYGNIAPKWTAVDLKNSNNITFNGNQIYGKLIGDEIGIRVASGDVTGMQPNTIVGNSLAALNGPAIVLAGTVNQTVVTSNSMNGVLGGGVSISHCPLWARDNYYSFGQCVTANNASYIARTAGRSSPHGTGPTSKGIVVENSLSWENLGALPSNGDLVIANIVNGLPDLNGYGGVMRLNEGGLLPGSSGYSLGTGSAVWGQIWSRNLVLRNGAISSSLTIDDGGNVTLNTAPLFVAQAFKGALAAPSSSHAECIAGQFFDDANYHYVCTSPNAWKRVSLSRF